MSVLAFSARLGRFVRQDAPAALGRSTRSLIDAAVRDGNADEAGRLFEYLCVELANVRHIFGVWNWHMVCYYLGRSGSESWSRLVHESIAPWIATTAGVKNAPAAAVAVEGRDARLSVSALPWIFHLTEGQREYHATLGSPEEQDARWAASQANLQAMIRKGDTHAVDPLLDVYIGEARLIHDVVCDWAWALLTIIGRTWGETVLGEVLRVTEEPWVTVRYEKIRELSALDALHLTVEGMRGHLSGPNRRGEISIVEEEDRYVLSFDACGTGGRMRRGDPLVGSESRLGPPYNFMDIKGAYEWTWSRPGVCAYCAHCAVVNQILPIEKLGRPMRMTLYPERPDDACHWVIYKDPNGFPEEAFTQVGHKRPETPRNASSERAKNP